MKLVILLSMLSILFSCTNGDGDIPPKQKRIIQISKGDTITTDSVIYVVK